MVQLSQKMTTAVADTNGGSFGGDFMGQIQAFLEQDEDLAHEEEVSRAPYSLSPWWEYIKAKQNSPSKIRNVIYERAVKHLPGSYKLWRAYLQDRMRQVRATNSETRSRLLFCFHNNIIMVLNSL